jgi:membrane associated rhomboid family serine protease
MPTLQPVTKALLLICTAVYCLQLLVGNSMLYPWFALYPVQWGQFWPWQLVSYALLHGSSSHLLMNMLGLWMFGAELEATWGPKRFLQLLLAGTVTAALVQLAFQWLTGGRGPTIGASGAIFGLLLAYGVVFANRRMDLMMMLPLVFMAMPFQLLNTIGLVLFVVMMLSPGALPFLRPVPVRARTMVMIFGAVELMVGVLFNTGIAHFAHLGGMLGALLLIYAWRGRLPFGNRRRH